MVDRIVDRNTVYDILDTIRVEDTDYLLLYCEEKVTYVEKVIENCLPFYFLPPEDLTIEHNLTMSFYKWKQYQLLKALIEHLQNQNRESIITMIQSFKQFLTQNPCHYFERKLLTREAVDHTFKEIEELFREFEQFCQPNEEYIVDPSYDPSIVRPLKKELPKPRIIPQNIEIPTIEIKIDEPISVPQRKFTFRGFAQAFALVSITAVISLGSLFYILFSV